MSNHLSVPVTEETQVGEARRLAVKLVTEAGFDEEDTGRVAIVATEAARNLVKHAHDGELLLCIISVRQSAGLELISIDRGPGMLSFEECTRDGYSTTGTAGTGLGAILRMSDTVDFYSVPGQGTAMLIRMFKKGTEERPETKFEVGAVNVPVRGETECGDAWVVTCQPERMLTVVADGLGHGPQAAKASREAIRVALEFPASDICELLDEMHSALRSTRGASVSIAELRPGASHVCFAGIGNVSGVVLNAQSMKIMVSHNGTLGHTIRRCQEFTYPWRSDSVLVMHSDGISTQWDLGRYPGLMRRDPTLIAAVIYRDFKRSRDDATVVVVRERVA